MNNARKKLRKCAITNFQQKQPKKQEAPFFIYIGYVKTHKRAGTIAYVIRNLFVKPSNRFDKQANKQKGQSQTFPK